MKGTLKHRLLTGAAIMLAAGIVLAGCSKPPAAPTPTAAPKPTTAVSPAPSPTAKPAASPAPAPPPGKVLRLRLASGLNATHETSKVAQWFADEVTKRTGGKAKVETYFGGQLFNHEQVIDGVRTGGAELALYSIGTWAALSPVYSFPNIFFLCDNEKTYMGSRDAVVKTLDELTNKFGQKVLYVANYGEVGMVTSKPVKKVEDMKGLRIRGAAKGGWDSVEALGGQAFQIASAEVYDAIAKGAIDGEATGLGTFVTRKHFEVMKYVITPFNVSTWMVAMNAGVYKDLPKDVLDVVTQVAKEASLRNDDATRTADVSYRKTLSENLELTILASADAKPWIAKVQPVVDAWLKDSADKGHGDFAKAIFDAYTKARG